MAIHAANKVHSFFFSNDNIEDDIDRSFRKINLIATKLTGQNKIRKNNTGTENIRFPGNE